MVKISVILSSTRPNSNGQRVYSWVDRMLKIRGHEIFKTDPLEHPQLQVFTERYDKSEGRLESLMQVSKGINSSDAIILLVAEYNNTFTGALKNALDTFYPEYKNKVFGIISYSTGGFGGVRAAAQIKSIVPALGGILVPKTVAISKVVNVLDERGNLIDKSYDDNLNSFLEELEYYVDKNKKIILS